MKSRVIKSAVFITILSICNCTGITMEQNNNRNIMNQGNNNIIGNNNNVIKNTNKDNDEVQIFRPVPKKRLNRRNVMKRPKAPYYNYIDYLENNDIDQLLKEIKNC